MRKHMKKDEYRRPSFRRLLQEAEEGNFVDQIGSIVILAFVIAMLFAYAAFGKMVEMRLAIDNIAKEYLYRMEQQGVLTTGDEAAMIVDLGLIGCDTSSVSFQGTTNRGNNQAAYGDKMILAVRVTFDNPLYTLLSAERHDANGQAFEATEMTITNTAPADPNDIVTTENNFSYTGGEGNGGTLFTLMGVSQTITYQVSMSATSKW